MNFDDLDPDQDGQVAINFDKFVREMIAAKEHWIFMIESPDWHFVLGRIEDEFFSEDTLNLSDFGTIISACGSSKVCWLRRDRVPVEVVALRFGLTIKQVHASRLIHLKPLPPPPVEPTVNYVGEA